MKKDKSKNFVPYGKEWEKELMKFSKKDLIEAYRKVLLKLNCQEADFKKRLKTEIGKRIVKNGLSRGGQRLMDLKEIEEIINKI